MRYSGSTPLVVIWTGRIQEKDKAHYLKSSSGLQESFGFCDGKEKALFGEG